MPRVVKNYSDIDLSKFKFARLQPVKVVEGCRTKWICKCDCGNIKEVYANLLISGRRKSCGCLERESREKLVERSKKHGKTDTVIYEKWCSMKYRCYNPQYKYYNRYGGRGIKVCDEWLGEHGFENFLKWAYEAGYDDSKKTFEQTLDRINTDGDYEPSNCRWATQVEQVKNRSNACLIEDIDGEKLTSFQFDKKHGINKKGFSYRRIRKGIDAKSILDEWSEYIFFLNSNEYMTTKDAELYYGVCRATLDNWIRKGKIESKRVRNKLYIKREPKTNK